jgi:hypothetical protein
MEQPKVEKVAPETVKYATPAEEALKDRVARLEDMLVRGGSTDAGLIPYGGHQRSPGTFYGGTENPSINASQYRLNYDGKLYATQMHAKAFFYTSDIADKEEVKPLTNALEKVSQIQGVSFRWKDGGEDAGVIAQQVQELIPEAVMMEYESGKLSVNAAALIGYLVAAVRELKTEVEELKGDRKV